MQAAPLPRTQRGHENGYKVGAVFMTKIFSFSSELKLAMPALIKM